MLLSIFLFHFLKETKTIGIPVSCAILVVATMCGIIARLTFSFPLLLLLQQQILGFCPNLAFSTPGRDPIAQEMNQVFQNRVSNDTLGATPIPPVTCPGSTPYNYYNNGVTFSLTLLDFCGLIPAIDAPDANLTVCIHVVHTRGHVCS